MIEENIPLCAWKELAANPAKGFAVKSGDRDLNVFVVLFHGRLYGYLNRCPHTGVNLDWLPDQFLDASNKIIICATHGAQFRIEDGYCIHGPCSGKSLTPVALSIDDDRVFLQSGCLARFPVR